MNRQKNIYLIYFFISCLPLFSILYPQIFSLQNLQTDIRNFLINLPYFSLILAALLGINLGIRNVFFVNILLLISYFILLKSHQGALTNYIEQKAGVIIVLSCSIPFSLISAITSKQGKFFSRSTIFLCFWCALPFLIFLKLLVSYPDKFFKLSSFGADWIKPLSLPLLSLVGFIILLKLLLLAVDKKTKAFNIGCFFSVIILLVSLNMGMDKKSFATDGSLIISYCVISITILHSVYRLYWESVYFDPLTGIPNRRAMIDKFDQLHKGYSVALVDIDKFKSFNDTYGHDEGDNVLKLVANMLYELSGKKAYRFGGEEFVIVYEHMNEAQLIHDLNWIRDAISRKPFFIRQGAKNRTSYRFPALRIFFNRLLSKTEPAIPAKKLQITVSMGGVVKMPITRVDAKTPYEDFLKLADNALYQAKENGRNRVEIADHI